MTTEEKVKAYDEILAKAKELKESNPTDEGIQRWIEDTFPELKESEDERIRNKLLKMFNDMERDESILDDYGLDKLKTIVWLEKQCEQKPVEWGEEDENEYNHILKILNLVAEEQETKGYNNLINSANWLKSIKDRIQSNQSNKPQGKTALEAINEKTVDNSNKIIKPKFHEGEWVVSPMGVYWHIDKISNNRYEVTSNTGASTDWPLNTKLYHRFTIQDAKPGDIIYVESKFNTFDFIGIFYTLENGNFWCYCDVSSDSDIYNDYLEYWEFDNDKGFVALDRYNFYPATKEQRDCLFEKMKEAGYEWDAEKKELKHYKKS